MLPDFKIYSKQHGTPSVDKQNLELKCNNIYISTPPPNKYLGRNRTKYVQDLCKENYNTLMNKIRELNK